ncbi:hypothetical protein D3C81_2173960 [compost metagenome]
MAITEWSRKAASAAIIRALRPPKRPAKCALSAMKPSLSYVRQTCWKSHSVKWPLPSWKRSRPLVKEIISRPLSYSRNSERP